MDAEKIYTIIITAVVTFILTKGWDWWRESEKNKYEERKHLRKALFGLMNFWQTLQSWDFESQVSLANRMLFEQFERMGAKPEDLEELRLKDEDKAKLISFQTQSASVKLKALQSQFQEAIDKLAELSPLIASELHEIHLRTPFEPIVSYIRENLDDGKERSEYDKKMLSGIESKFFHLYKSKLSERIRPYILEIAGQIDRKTNKSTTKYLDDLEKDWKEAFSKPNEEDLQTVAENYVGMLMEVHQEATDKLPPRRTVS